MTRLLHRKVLVVGATGGVGEGIVRALLERGATVIAVSRSAEKLDDLRTYLADAPSGELVPFVARVDQDEQASAHLYRQLRQQFDIVDSVVIAVGNWGEANVPLLDVTDRIWAQSIADNLTSQFRAIRTLTPLINPATGSLVHINGLSADLPFPGAALIGLTGAAMKSLVVTLAKECGPAGPRIYELILGVIRTRQRERQGQNNPAWFTAYEVGQYVAGLVTGENPMVRETLHYLVQRE
ncbi:MAG: SDR family oxidoreductase [Caldilineaceae bacterium]|nr:SDR family oxidoreductase [Caldilineaceae bacterium]